MGAGPTEIVVDHCFYGGQVVAAAVVTQQSVGHTPIPRNDRLGFLGDHRFDALGMVSLRDDTPIA